MFVCDLFFFLASSSVSFCINLVVQETLTGLGEEGDFVASGVL
jgi:hypothetical protein